MSNPLYLLEDVSKTYGARTVLHVPELAVQRGEVLAIMGPSGAGKSTLLRLLNFLEPSTTGTLTFDGHPVHDGHQAPLALRRRVTMVFQRPQLFNASVLDNVLYGLKLRGSHKRREKALGVLERVGLLQLARARASTLSGGEMQRVALARALVLEPDVLLLDEPTANLDPTNVALIEQLVRYANHRGTTVLLATHNVFQARRLSHRAVLLLDGLPVEISPTEDMFARPRDARTMAFVQGEMVY